MIERYVCDVCPFDQTDYREATAHIEATSHIVRLTPPRESNS